MRIKKGDLYYAKLGFQKGSQQGGYRPVVIVQNNRDNYSSPTTIIAPITKKITERNTHLILENEVLDYKSSILAEQVRVIDKTRLSRYIGKLPKELISKLNNTLCNALAIKIGGDRK